MRSGTLYASITTMDYREQIEKIRQDYLRARISHETAKERVELLLVEMNKKGALVAKEFGKKYKKLTFGYVFR